MSHHR